ncbi:uncharacterized protein LOC114936529 [Nylanderia fulva]|uniref:uncharacterized protein LOC114936529 n=1 Tax=Nylanderia fulva TaxID=613905 RepID=UPI0010FAF3A9|nr:uncharacterized protein LOC114936529 [Nylanderia fulva]
MLRKQIATYTAMLNIEDTQVDNLANFMGHAKEIHKNIYRVPVPVREMTDVSRLLEAAMGNENENDNNEDDISDTGSVSQLSVISEEIAQRNIYMSDSDDNDDNDNTENSTDANSTSFECHNTSQNKKGNLKCSKGKKQSRKRRSSEFYYLYLFNMY